MGAQRSVSSGLAALGAFTFVIIEREPYGFGFGFRVVGTTDVEKKWGKRTQVAGTVEQAIEMLLAGQGADVRKCCRCREYVNLGAFQTLRCGVKGGKNRLGHVAWRCPACERQRVADWYRRQGSLKRMMRRGRMPLCNGKPADVP